MAATVVTSIRIPEDLKEELDRKPHVNKSKICVDALMKSLSVDEERKIIRKRIDMLYSKIDELSKREEDLGKLQSEETNRIVTDMEKVLVAFAKQYERNGRIEGMSIRTYAKKLDMDPIELEKQIEEYLDIVISHDPVEL